MFRTIKRIEELATLNRVTIKIIQPSLNWTGLTLRFQSKIYLTWFIFGKFRGTMGSKIKQAFLLGHNFKVIMQKRICFYNKYILGLIFNRIQTPLRYCFRNANNFMFFNWLNLFGRGRVASKKNFEKKVKKH